MNAYKIQKPPTPGAKESKTSSNSLEEISKDKVTPIQMYKEGISNNNPTKLEIERNSNIGE